MKRFLFVAFALVVLLVVPVSAYTLLNDYTFSPSSGDMNSVWYVYANNIGSFYANVTRIEFTSTQCYKNSVSDLTGSGTVTFNNSATGELYAYAEYSWSADQNKAWDDCSLTFSDITWVSDPGVTNYFSVKGVSNANLFSDQLWNFKKASTTGMPSYNFGFPSDATNYPAGNVKVYSGSSVTAPEASFTCTPTSQFPGAEYSVECTDTSTNNPTDWLWVIDWDNTGIDNYMTATTRNASLSFAYPGIYSVNLRANNSAGFDWENKSSYVSISDNATPNNCSIPPVSGMVRSMAQCVDSQTNGAIAGCDLSLLDKEGGAWSNITDRFDGTWCIDTYPGHHIDAYGWADDYTPSPSYRLNLPASDTVMYELLMHPGYVPPAAEGKVWLYVLVNDADTGAALEDAYVRISGTDQVSKSDYTEASGQVMFQWANASTAYITASKAGYTSGTKTVTTSDYGPDTLRIELHRGTVTPTATMTTGPGGTVPTTIGPWGSQTPGPGVTMPSGYTNTQGQAIMDLLAYHGYDLVLLCILVTILALLGVRLGGK